MSGRSAEPIAKARSACAARVSIEWYDKNCGEGALYVTIGPMAHVLIGYARCSTDKQDLAAQHQALVQLGVATDRIYTDKGFTGTNRARPGLDQALAAVRSGDTLVVPKLDRLARSEIGRAHV